MWTHRTIIVPATHAEAARAACAGLAGPGGSGMFTTPLSATGTLPASHYISSGLIEDQFASLLPLMIVTHAEDGTSATSIQPGDAVLTAQLADDAGLPFTEEGISMLFAAVDVSEQPAEDALGRLGLRMITETEV